MAEIRKGADISLSLQHAVQVEAWENDMHDKSLQRTNYRGEEDNVCVLVCRSVLRGITEKLKNLGYSVDDFPVDCKAWRKLMGEPKKVTDPLY